MFVHRNTVKPSTSIIASPVDTREWATRPFCSWPCSELSGHSVRIKLDENDSITECIIDGKDNAYVSVDELYAFIDYAIHGDRKTEKNT